MTEHEEVMHEELMETSQEHEAAEGQDAVATAETGNSADPAGSVTQSGEYISSLVGYLSRSLVRGGQDQITVRHAEGAHEGEVKVTVTVPQGELGKVIGRGGRTATAIRTIVGAAAQRSGLSAQVEFSDGRPGGGRGRPSRGGNNGGRRGGPRRDDRPRRQG